MRFFPLGARSAGLSQAGSSSDPGPPVADDFPRAEEYQNRGGGSAAISTGNGGLIGRFSGAAGRLKQNRSEMLREGLSASFQSATSLSISGIRLAPPDRGRGAPTPVSALHFLGLRCSARPDATWGRFEPFTTLEITSRGDWAGRA